MSISYQWNVNTVDVYPSDEGHSNVIYNVHWRLNATDTEVDAEGNPYVAMSGNDTVAAIWVARDNLPPVNSDVSNANSSGELQLTITYITD